VSASVSWGILGAARFAREHMAPAIVAGPGGRLAALASRGGEAAAGPFRTIAPDLVVYDSYARLLDDPGIDAVYIPLPNHLHVNWTLRALAAGKHVLCEKPIAMHADEFNDLITARDRAGRLAAEAFMIAHHPQWQFVRQQLQQQRIGPLRHIEAMFCFYNDDVQNIRNRAETGGGAVRDIGVYVLGAARLATGHEPHSIRSHAQIERDVDVFTAIQAKFDEVTFSGTVSMRMGPMQRMTFYGEAGALTLHAPFNAEVFGDARVELRLPSGETLTHHFNRARQYQIQVQRFNHSVLAGAEFPWPLEFSRATQEAIDTVLGQRSRIDS